MFYSRCKRLYTEGLVSLINNVIYFLYPTFYIVDIDLDIIDKNKEVFPHIRFSNLYDVSQNNNLSKYSKETLDCKTTSQRPNKNKFASGVSGY